MMFYNCGATLINRRYVITAAHCHDTSSEDKQIAQVVLGDHDLSTNPDCITNDREELVCDNKPVQRFDVTLDDITVHEDWDLAHVTDKANDIALVRLPTPAYTANEIARGVHVMPICLPWGKLPGTRDRAEFPEGKVCTYSLKV